MTGLFDHDLGPNWFAAVMGTGIVALAAKGLPIQVPGQDEFALAVWALASGLLVILLTVVAGGWVARPQRVRAHLANPVMSHFFGALPMALLTVGAGTLLVGRDVLGLRAALVIDGVLWTAGTVLGLLCAVVVPYVAFIEHENAPGSAFGGWLMPVVPPMVSATTGGFLLPYLPAGQARETMLLGCYAMFGMSLIASLLVISQIWNRLSQHGIGAAAMVPTFWIVLGPIGQSITAANVLGGVAHDVLPRAQAETADAAGILYGLVMWGFAAAWMMLAIAITIRAARNGLPFSLTWWSFTFPVGTVVTGTSQLALRTGANALTVAAVVLFIGLIAAWGTVVVRTLDGIRHGTLVPAPLTVPAPAVYAI